MLVFGCSDKKYVGETPTKLVNLLPVYNLPEQKDE